MEPLNAMTVDVEDYFQVSAFERYVDRGQWDRWECRVVANTHRVLRLLERRGVRATFFVLGWIADRYPALVRDIHADGHEIGSHGYWHRLIYEQSPQEFRDDLRQSRDVLQDIVGARVTAYRAPSFSVTRRSLWALEILAEEGFLTDSSVFPIYHDRYGMPDADPAPHAIATSRGPLWEFPAAVVPFARWNLPVGGGGYFRLYPLRWTLFCLRRINRTYRRPFVFYVHPWELDPEQPRLRVGSRLARFRHYVNLARSEAKLDVLCREFRFGRLCEAVEQVAAGPAHGAPESARPDAVLEGSPSAR